MKYITVTILALTLIMAGCGGNPEAAKERGFEFYDLKKFPDALPLLEKAFAGGIDDPELIVRLAYCRAVVGDNVLGAINILRDSALKYPRYARTYFELGFIAQQFGPTEGQQNIHQAIGFTRKAAEIDTTDYKFRDNLGMFFFMLGDLDSAEYWFTSAAAVNRDNPELNARLLQIKELKARNAAEDSAASATQVIPPADGNP